VCISAGIWKGNNPDGSAAPVKISNIAWFDTPKLPIIAFASLSNSPTTIGFARLIHTITGLLCIIILVSSMVCRSLSFEAVMVLFL